ncbi:hydroxysqualene dehydroxylase HpnE [Alicyclobacillus herbarius]|uniref:hydroxysqualene dehydroxylase HpnE n=1 Tax=Alicyclobacillus herbarius TaxID=122960 RepID=UPI00047E9940|nr:hydroxysqualene dehydroxylase HpnE [Alicyclobacillus herbarius]
MAETNRLAPRRILVIGAGWAGLAAALELTRTCASAEVHLYERRAHPGGRAFSFVHAKTGMMVDNGQHVLLGCCTDFMHCLQEIGQEAAVRFQPLLSIPVFYQGRWQNLESRRLPGPLHLLPSILRYRHLSVGARWRALRAALAVLTTDVRRMDGQSFASWLSEHQQSQDAVECLWDLIGVAVLNGQAHRVSAGLAVQALRMGVVTGWKSARLGYFCRPLSELAESAVQVLLKRGVKVHFGTPIHRLAIDKGVIVGGHTNDGEFIPADAVITAVPHDVLPRLLPGEPHLPQLAQVASVPWSPILNVYLLYDRPVMQGDVAVAPGAVAPFVFNRGRIQGLPEWDGRFLSVSISAADDLRQERPEHLVALADENVRQMFARRSGGAKLTASAPIWQSQATFLAEPGFGVRRLDCCGLLPGLYVAGDWTDTGWPACLEGAVRSGFTAARAAVDSMLIQENKRIV